MGRKAGRQRAEETFLFCFVLVKMRGEKHKDAPNLSSPSSKMRKQREAEQMMKSYR